MDKQPNYSREAEARILAETPFGYETAKALAKELGKHPRSIVAKVKRMEADESVEGVRPFYLAKPAYVRKDGGDVESKAAIVQSICAVLDVDPIEGLAKADKRSLEALRKALVIAAQDVSS